jgi:hypothetical protein
VKDTEMRGDEFPAGVTDSELLSYLEGEAGNDLAERIEKSEELLQRVQQLERETAWLTANLYRHTCPDTDELGDLHLNLLPEAKARAIERHLAHCPYCSRELVQYRDFLGDPPAQPGLTKRIITLLAEFLDSTSPSENALAPAYGLRGKRDRLSVFRADGLQISLEAQDDVEKPGHQAIVGVITGSAATPLSIDLWREGEYLYTARADRTGGFTLPALLPGVYELIIKGAGVIVHIQTFSL